MTATSGDADVGSASSGEADVGSASSGAADVVVTGRSLPALLAALDFAEVGIKVAIAGGAVELPAEAERDPEGDLLAFMERIAAPEAALHQTEPRPPWLLDIKDHWAPQPEPAVFGVPAVPLSQASLQMLGTGGALRAYRDRVAPLLTIGKTQSFGVLVRKRLGRAVRDRLVQPLVWERFGVDADRVDVAIAAPGLNEALSRTGSLTAATLAYSERNVARETTVEPEGGWGALAVSVLERLEFLDAQLFDGEVSQIEPLEDGWVVSLSREGSEPLSGTEAQNYPQSDLKIETRALVVDHPRVMAEWANSSALVDIGAEWPHRVRLHAEIAIREPNDAELLSASGCGAVQLLGEWAVRSEAAGDTVFEPADFEGGPVGKDEWRAVLGGPVSPEIETGELGNTLNEVLDAVGASAAPEADWLVEWRAAPFATVEQRDRVTESLREQIRERPEVLCVGRSLHGDDLSAALGAAHSGAVDSRRRLLGLTG